jgi:hypothetical protein
MEPLGGVAVGLFEELSAEEDCGGCSVSGDFVLLYWMDGWLGRRLQFEIH